MEKEGRKTAKKKVREVGKERVKRERPNSDADTLRTALELGFEQALSD